MSGSRSRYKPHATRTSPMSNMKTRARAESDDMCQSPCGRAVGAVTRRGQTTMSGNEHRDEQRHLRLPANLLGAPCVPLLPPGFPPVASLSSLLNFSSSSSLFVLLNSLYLPARLLLRLPPFRFDTRAFFPLTLLPSFGVLPCNYPLRIPTPHCQLTLRTPIPPSCASFPASSAAITQLTIPLLQVGQRSYQPQDQGAGCQQEAPALRHLFG